MLMLVMRRGEQGISIATVFPNAAFCSAVVALLAALLFLIPPDAAVPSQTFSVVWM